MCGNVCVGETDRLRERNKENVIRRDRQKKRERENDEREMDKDIENVPSSNRLTVNI